MTNSDNNSSDSNIIEFYLDPSFIDTKKVTCIGIKQSINSIVVEINNEIILQTIHVGSFSDSTIKPIKKQLSELLTEFKEEDRRKSINSIITCINRNIDVISKHCIQSPEIQSTSNEENNKVDELIKLVLY